uniref:Uncharacterized protein n=1 Tax=Octactis speculum TaxID=3111310 RepID=A0A7S2AIN3_9STRA
MLEAKRLRIPDEAEPGEFVASSNFFFQIELLASNVPDSKPELHARQLRRPIVAAAGNNEIGRDETMAIHLLIDAKGIYESLPRMLRRLKVKSHFLQLIPSFWVVADIIVPHSNTCHPLT